jgi:hypothetical protein
MAQLQVSLEPRVQQSQELLQASPPLAHEQAIAQPL